MQPDPAHVKFSLDRTSILILDADPMSMSILSQILAGFGAKYLCKCTTLEEAKVAGAQRDFDLVFVDPGANAEGYDLIPWLRRDPVSRNKFCSVMVVTGHTQSARITVARDYGANFVIAKPLTPAKISERIGWLGREKRQYVECPGYAGPDRRFKFQGPPVGTDGRRGSDLSGAVGDASQPNMSQADIDALMQPRRVVL